MKKRPVWLIVLLLCVSFYINAQVGSTKDNPVVSIGKLEQAESKTWNIPVTLTGNDGCMGFYMTFTYDPDHIKILKIDRGSITQEGVFDDNHKLHKGTCDVLWSGTDEVKEDGTMFVIQVESQSSSLSKGDIHLSYSTDDTFDGAYAPVTWSIAEESAQGSTQDSDTGDSTDAATSDLVNEVLDNVNGDALHQWICEYFQVSSWKDLDTKTKSDMSSGLKKLWKKLEEEGIKISDDIKKQSSSDQVKLVRAMDKQIDEDHKVESTPAVKEHSTVLDNKGGDQADNTQKLKQKDKVLKKQHNPLGIYGVVFLVAVTVIVVVGTVLTRKRRNEDQEGSDNQDRRN